MGMIQGIDGGALLAAFRQGRSDRATDDKTKAAAEEAKQWKGLMGQVMGGQSSGGVAGNFAPSQPAQAPDATGQTFDQAFSPQAMGAIQSGAPVSGDPYGYSVASNPDRATWDRRADGSQKGMGWLGLRQRPDGNVSSEISAGITVNGKEMDVPLMVPGLTKPEMDYLMTHEPDLEKNPNFFKDMPQSILAKAQSFAEQRLAQGKSPFRQEGEPDALGAPPAALPARAAPSQVQPDPNILRQMAVLRPEQAGQIITALKNLNESDLKQQQAKNDIMGAAAHYVQQGKSPQERLDRFQHAAPQLLAMGWTQGQLQQAASDLSDPALQGFQGMAIDYDKMIDNELAERKFQAGDNVAVVPGGNVANIKPDGSAHYVIGGGGAQTAGPAPVQVQSIEQAQKLPPGTRFIDPNGVERVVPGGGASNGTGGFRPVSNGAAVIQQLFPNVRVTDGRRPADSALGRANPKSWHVRSGGAVDVAPIPGMTFEQYVGRVKSAGYNVIEAIDEVKHPSAHATGPHWHIVIGEG